MDCVKIADFWINIQNFIRDHVGIRIYNELDWSNQSIFLNLVHCHPNHVINLIVLIAKQYIYRSHCAKTVPIFNQFRQEIDIVEKHGTANS